MKSKQIRESRTFVVALLVIIQLSSAFPTNTRESAEKDNCHSLLAIELDSKLISNTFVKKSVDLNKSKTFLLRADNSNNSLLKTIEGGQVCEGVEGGIQSGTGFQVIVSNEKSEHVQKPLLFDPLLLITPSAYTPSDGNLLKVTCGQSVVCLNITYTEVNRFSHQQLFRRDAASHMTSEASAGDPGDGMQTRTIVGGILVTAISLLVLVSVVALCGGSSTYEPSTNTAAITLSEEPVAVVATAEVSTNQAVEPVTQKQNGNISQDQQPPTSNKPSQPNRLSLSPPPDPNAPPPPANAEERKERARTLSARSYDPLPEIPKLDLAEELPSKDDDEDDKEDPYSYARVPKADEVPQSDSSDEDGPESPANQTSPSKLVAPYGKVTSDKGKRGSLDDGEYAEVIGEGNRSRSATAPVDPSEVGLFRDTRAFTESAAHLPLPAIPKERPPTEEENEMYDSIPDTMSGKQAKPARRRKERLYESVDEMADDTEDMYESVPEELKPDSPVVLSPVALSPNSPDRPPLIPDIPPRPPDSPIPAHHPPGAESKPEEPHSKGKKNNRKALEKTLSAVDPLEKQKRTFSLFGRGKTKSVSAGVGKPRKKGEKEKETQPSKPHQGEPLPDIPLLTSPSQHPSSPVIAFPRTVGDEDEDMYDKPQLPQDPRQRIASDSDASTLTTEDAKARAKTLPAGLRSPGIKFRQDIPLPEVPEDSGQGMVLVTHQRHLEPGSEKTKPYDIVHISTPPPESADQDEPNYDTVRPEVFMNPSLEVRADPDPGYDRVGIKLDNGSENPLSDEDKSPEDGASPGEEEEVKVTALQDTASIDDSLATPVPEHDEIGYARVPEMYLMRKRAMSASQGARQKAQTSESQKTSADDSDVNRVTSPDEMYAIIDKTAKKKARQKKVEDHETLSSTEREGGASPIPPPLPPVGDLGDLSEFNEPPLPERSEDADRLMVEVENDSGYSRVLKVGQSENPDPPYAKVKSNIEHPYAELNIGSADKPDTTSGGESPDAVASPTSPVNEMSSAYDTVGDVVTTPEAKAAAVTVDVNPDDESHMYDALGPTSSPCEVTVQVSSPEEDVPQNLYDTLEPVVQNGTGEVENEGPYEEIDENTRQNLQKLHQTHSKPA